MKQRTFIYLPTSSCSWHATAGMFWTGSMFSRLRCVVDIPGYFTKRVCERNYLANEIFRDMVIMRRADGGCQLHLEIIMTRENDSILSATFNSQTHYCFDTHLTFACVLSPNLSCSIDRSAMTTNAMRVVLFAVLAIAFCASPSTARVLQQSQAAAAAQAQAGTTGSGEFATCNCRHLVSSWHQPAHGSTSRWFCLASKLRSSCQSAT